MKDADAKVAVFKAVLKGYFFQHKDIQKLYSLPTDAPMKDGKYVDAGLELIRKGREEAFELFWKNLNYNTMMNGDGTPVRQTMADFANDFLMGKPISFLGIGNDNFVKIEAGDQQKIMYKHFLDYNLGKKEFIEPYTGSSAAKTTTNYEPELDAKYDIASTVKPKSGGFWNKIVKAFTGHSSAKWAAYDAHLKKESIAAAKKTAREYLKNNKHKVELGDKKTMISADPLNKDTVEATFIMARNKMATVDFLHNSYIPVNEHERKYSDAFKAVKPELAEEAKKEEAIEEAELDDDFKPQKTQKEIEKEQLLAKKKAGEMLQASANKIISQIDRSYEKDKTKKYIDLKSSFKDTSKLVASFMNMTKCNVIKVILTNVLTSKW